MPRCSCAINNWEKRFQVTGCVPHKIKNRIIILYLKIFFIDIAPPVIKQHCPKNFIKVPANQWTFHTDEWKNKQTTIHSPLCGDVMINMQMVEQISFETGTFHIGNDQNIYKETAEGIDNYFDDYYLEISNIKVHNYFCGNI